MAELSELFRQKCCARSLEGINNRIHFLPGEIKSIFFFSRLSNEMGLQILRGTKDQCKQDRVSEAA